MMARTTLERRGEMFQHEEMSYGRESEALGYTGHARFEESPFGSNAGQKLIQDTSSLAPTVGQRLTLALVSLGMLMGMTTLLTILATAKSSPGWAVVPLLFVLTLFTAAVVSINIAFSRRVW